MKKIILDFDGFQLSAELFGSRIAEEFHKHLPYSIELTTWGAEAYGSIGIDLGKEESPVPEISPGGLAYSHQGNYLCIFYGQRPAWPVEHIGNIIGDDWKKLEHGTWDHVTVKRDK
ncbi:MAG: hypothetical protein KKH98_15360 [Spirochaetes bacterium]|nr:hypothetical protein [Spirochaetota bacterium]